jgi:glycosyltransferase involved in cell wall biosynthesis
MDAVEPRNAPRALRLLVVSLRYPPHVGGGFELLTQNLVHALRSRGHHVSVLAGRAEDYADPDVEGALLPELAGEDPFARALVASSGERFALHFFRTANYRATARALEATGAQACLFLNLGLVSLAPLVAARHRGLPALVYVADPWPLNHWLLAWPAGAEKSERRAWLERAWRAFRDLVGFPRVLVASSHLARRFERDGIAHELLSVLHPPIPTDLELLAEGVAPARRAPGEPLRVACLSSFWSGKGQDVLVEAVRLARERGSSIECTLAGSPLDPAFRAELERRVRAAGLERACSFAAALPRAGVSELLARTHVFALPSTWEEPFSQATLEAMVHGVCPLVSDAGGSPEALSHGVEGWIARAGDARSFADGLVALADDEPRRLRLACAARERARASYTHAAFVARIERELLALMGAA